MALRPCSGCEQRTPAKLSTLYWSWMRADHSRVAYRQWLCLACYITRVVPLHSAMMDSLWLCPMCHSDTTGDMDPVFCKSYVPGQTETLLELATCPKCAVELRNGAIQNAELLPDRALTSGGQAPRQDADDVWAALGRL